jgi:membrane-associated phospholipid phosphatase
MQSLIDSSIAIIIAIQGMGEWLTLAMRFFSNLGTEDFFFLVLPLIYWCIDSALGLRVGLILTTTGVFNYAGKLLFAGPRPYWVSSHVKGLWPETTFGAPSGHAQNAMSVWGVIAVHMKKTSSWIIAGLLIFLIGFSRIYLGSHFPHDVALGWLLGGLILFAFVKLEKPVLEWFLPRNLFQQILIGFVISLIFILIGFSAAIFRESFHIPEQWISNALLASPDVLAPVEPHGIFTLAGTFFGLVAGAAWILHNGGYQVTGPIWNRSLRYVIGLIGVLVFWMGLGAIIPDGDGFIFYLLRYLRYSLVGWWVAAGAPWAFVRFALSETPQRSI